MSTITERPDGTVFIELPKEEAKIVPSEVVVKAAKSIHDLPAEADVINPIALTILYELFGLRDDAICEAMSITNNELVQFQGHPAHKFLRETVLQNVLDFQSDEVTKFFRSHGKKAAAKIVEHIDNGRANVSLKAAAEVLDRGGFMPPQGKVNGSPMERGLNIMIINKGDQAKTVEGVK